VAARQCILWVGRRYFCVHYGWLGAASLKSISPQVKVAYHSDGNIQAIIPELIEIGLDVLNPIQPA
jgi:hypothetical protein